MTVYRGKGIWHVLGMGVAKTSSPPELPPEPDSQHLLGAHSPQNLKRNKVALEKKD